MRTWNEGRRFPAKLALPCALASLNAATAQNVGPNTSINPYLLPTRAGVATTSILTVNDPAFSNVGGYRMVGIPDGLGAFRAEGQTAGFTLMMNHELSATQGIARAHGQTGSFVSRWEIAPDLSVTAGRDHNTSAADVWEYSASPGTWSNTPSALQRHGRFCSADLAAPSAYRFGSLGTDARIYLNGEEVGSTGRAYAHIVSGSAANQTWHLPHLGRFSWENAVASPFAQAKSIVMGTDDSTPGQVYMYVGNKTAAGNDVERAGLTNGNLFGIRAVGVPDESRGSIINGRFDLFNHGNVANSSGAALQSAGEANGVTEFLRPEDGVWDPRPGHERDFYFTTTDALTTSGGRSRLDRMRFDDIANPESGGMITALLTGTEGHEMLDNMTIDSHGRILLQEDPGSSSRLARVWLYDIDSGGYLDVAQHNSQFFMSGAPGFLTSNEESSGIIDAREWLGDGWFLANTMAHYAIAGELVEGGQLMALYVDPSIVPEPASVLLVGLAGLAFGRRR